MSSRPRWADNRVHRWMPRWRAPAYVTRCRSFVMVAASPTCPRSRDTKAMDSTDRGCDRAVDRKVGRDHRYRRLTPTASRRPVRPCATFVRRHRHLPRQPVTTLLRSCVTSSSASILTARLRFPSVVHGPRSSNSSRDPRRCDASLPKSAPTNRSTSIDAVFGSVIGHVPAPVGRPFTAAEKACSATVSGPCDRFRQLRRSSRGGRGSAGRGRCS